MILERGVIDAHFHLLKQHYPQATLTKQPDGTAVVHIPEFPFPQGWNKTTANLWFFAPNGYPTAPPDCFWLDADVRLASQTTPSNTGSNCPPWDPQGLYLWFSYHVGTWNPQRDTVLTYVRVVQQRLLEVR